jgi:hypothetical protein
MVEQISRTSQKHVGSALQALAAEVDNLKREFVELQQLRETVAEAERSQRPRPRKQF